MNKLGFSLIELLVAKMIASILGVMLFAAFYQINRFVPVIDNKTTIIEKAALVNAQLEKDFAGIIVPNEFYVRQPKEKQPQEKKQNDADAKKDAEQKKKKAEQESDGDEKKKKPFEKIFYSVNKSGMLDQLSFITTSSLQVYWGSKSGSAKPRMVRVLYKLKEEPGTKEGKKSYSLIRKETPKLEFEDIEKAQEYVLATHIKSLTMDYTAVLIEPEKKATPQAQNQKPAPKPELETKQLKEWQALRQASDYAKATTDRQDDEKNKKQMPLVPQVISVDISFWDSTKRKSVPFVFTYKVPSEFALKKSTEDLTGKMLGTLKEMFGQTMPQNRPTQVAQRPQSSFNFGAPRR
ncbi:hypothetical protein BH09DEP1_BH09DEP1_1970 [soil metagenome]